MSLNYTSMSRNPDKPQIDPERYARLMAEAKAPYRGLRMFIYLVFGSSGFIGGLVFLAQVIAGRDVAQALPNLALQAGVVALMIWLYRLDKAAGDRASR
ncbi:DUF3493 domain-containing protein [Leptolyngbya sp. AN02str]|uniref:DUF3493 domain-containing protein n=1 Tax=Leptolyngbya sp. AN02str TaxID=3423363 RepID=UPI003D31AEB7